MLRALLFLAAGLAQADPVIEIPRKPQVGEAVEIRVTEAGQPAAGVEVRVLPSNRQVGRLTVPSLGVRNGPTTISSTIATLYDSEPVIITNERADGWCEVLTPTGLSGYSTCSYFERTPFGQPAGTTNEAGRLTSSSLTFAAGNLQLAAFRNGRQVAVATIAVAPYEYDRRQTVAPGIEYREMRFVKGVDGPFTMQILEVDPTNPAVNLLPVRARDRASALETIGSMTRRYGATAGVNGGYFVTKGAYAGGSVGVYRWNGETFSSGSNRSALLLCEEAPAGRERIGIDVVNFRGRVIAGDGATIPLSGVNRARSEQDLVLYRSAIGPKTRTEGAGVEVLLNSKGTVLSVEEGWGNASIPVEGQVLSGTGAAAQWLRDHARVGSTMTVDAQLEMGNPAACKAPDVIGGGPRLVSKGEVRIATEHFAHEATRHPRTAAVETKRGTLLFVTLDGRQARSAGMRLDEFAVKLIELGAVEAINLDGGGSTTMIVNGQVKNSPSDGQERPVSDGILLFSIPDLSALARVTDQLARDERHVTGKAADMLRRRFEAAVQARSRGERDGFDRELEAILASLDGIGLSWQAKRIVREAVEALVSKTEWTAQSR